MNRAPFCLSRLHLLPGNIIDICYGTRKGVWKRSRVLLLEDHEKVESKAWLSLESPLRRVIR